MEDEFVNVTTVGGLKHVAMFGSPEPSATTSKTSISMVKLSEHPKLSVTVNVMELFPSSLNKNVPGSSSVEELGVTFVAADQS